MESVKQKGDRISHYQQKIMSKQGGQAWTKDVRVNVPLNGDFAFDDFFRVEHSIWKQSKVKSFTVWKRKENSYVSGLQFTYQSSKGPQSVTREGWVMSARNEQKRATTYNSKTFDLDDDEYIVKFIIRKGMIIDSFGVGTNKERKFSFGGAGGGEYSIDAPNGYHFTNFGGQFSEGWDSISSFSAEVQKIPDDCCDQFEQTETALSQLLLQRAVLRNIVPYLTTNELAKLFRLNKQFSTSRFDEGVHSILLNRCLSSAAPKLMKYLKKMIKNAHYNGESLIVERANKFFSLSKNMNENPHGEKQFEGYQITRNGGNGIIVSKDGDTSFFITSYGWDTIRWTKSFDQLYRTDEAKVFIDGIMTKEYAVVLAADFCDTGFGGEGEMKYQILDRDRKVIKEEEKSMKSIPREFTTFSFKYIHQNPEVIPDSVVFEVSGKDTCYWAGHYGAKIRNISFSLVPLEY